MKLAGVKIKFETFNDYNFLMDIAGNDLGALQGLSMLQEELPAEVSFHVPESYHKRIIGVGGKNIQRIMKLYGVYVKFSNAEEFAALGGYLDNDDNVVARTPAKNAINLESLKQSVMEMVNPKVSHLRHETGKGNDFTDTASRTRITRSRAFRYLGDTIVLCSARNRFSFMTLNIKPTRSFDSLTRRVRVIS